MNRDARRIDGGAGAVDVVSQIRRIAAQRGDQAVHVLAFFRAN
jgi:hypothetical protein